MRYVCFCYYDQAAFAACTPADLEEVGRICAPRDAELRATGRVVLNVSLGEPPTARTVRPGKGVTDGPYAASDEAIGALFVIEADDLDEAVRIASIHPSAVLGRYFGGGIEVRPVGP